MSEYTELLEDQTFAISPEDEDYEQRLLETARFFRPFGETLNVFLVRHGYQGDPEDGRAREAFVRARFREAGIPAPRGIRDWFLKEKRFERTTAFQLCFAFGLGVEETQAFFREVCLQRGYDCHSVPEAVYWWCARQGLSWQTAQEILAQVPEEGRRRMEKGDPSILYTSTILEQLEGISKPEDLVDYLCTNSEKFRYNNATATRFFRDLWGKIEGPDGLAMREAKRVAQPETEEDRRITVAADGDSIWTIYAQILGLDHWQRRVLGTDRSIKAVLKDNALLHPLAEASFPDREGIQKILKGDHLSHERVRKLLILVVFYSWWVRRLTDPANPNGRARPGDADRCLANLNRYLLDAGYPELYPGNPYDWIFLWALRDDCPLEAFRSYIGELFALKSEQT